VSALYSLFSTFYQVFGEPPTISSFGFDESNPYVVVVFSRQETAKIYQIKWAIKNVPIALLIMILKPKITFVKPGQNGVTERNGYG